MKRYWIITLILILMCSSVSFAKTVKRHYQDGTLQAVVSYDKKGKRNGPYKSYWANGKLMETGRYKNGVQVGPVKKYSIDGELITYDTF